MSECTHDCSTCSSNCSSRKQDFREPQNPLSNVKKVIGVVSGKGGVGKSMVTSLLAVLANRKGLSTAILDADITGPSVPKAFGLTARAEAMDEKNILPVRTKKRHQGYVNQPPFGRCNPTRQLAWTYCRRMPL